MRTWKDIPGLEGFYQVSNTGLIKSLDRIVDRSNNRGTFQWRYRGKVIKPRLSAWGYFQVTLYGGVKIQPYVHILVASAFIGVIPDGYDVNHKDGNKQNNNHLNLEIVTKSDNNKHAYTSGLKIPHYGINRSKLNIEAVLFIRNNKNITGVELAKKYGVSPAAISLVRLFKNKKNGLESFSRPGK